MSQRTASGSLDLFNLRQQLLAAGWDAFASDLAGEVAARQERPASRSVWSLVVDRSGRWRCTVTRTAALAQGREVVRSGHTFHVLKETQQVLTVAGNLNSQDDFAAVLAELTQLALAETSQPGQAAEGKTTWPEEQERRAEMTNL